MAKPSSKADKFPSKNKGNKVQSKKSSRHDEDEDDAFVSDDVVGGGSDSYFKPTDGDNKIRIISKPIFGWVAWNEDEEGDRKPVRTKLDDQPDMDEYEKDNKPKKFMTVAIIDHEDGKPKIWEITQQSIIKGIKALTANEDWGNPFSYDITINKKGEKLKTKYSVTPSPKKPLAKELVKEAENKPCNLHKLFDDENPWEIEEDDDTTNYYFK